MSVGLSTLIPWVNPKRWLPLLFLLGLATGFGLFLGRVLNESSPEEFLPVEIPPNRWDLHVTSMDGLKTELSKIMPFAFKRGLDTCYVFVQDFGPAKTGDAYRSNMAVSCRRQGLFW